MKASKTQIHRKGILGLLLGIFGGRWWWSKEFSDFSLHETLISGKARANATPSFFLCGAEGMPGIDSLPVYLTLSQLSRALGVSGYRFLPGEMTSSTLLKGQGVCDSALRTKGQKRFF